MLCACKSSGKKNEYFLYYFYFTLLDYQQSVTNIFNFNVNFLSIKLH